MNYRKGLTTSENVLDKESFTNVSRKVRSKIVSTIAFLSREIMKILYGAFLLDLSWLEVC